MNLKEFLQEEKQARKQRKLEKKLQKKSPLTKEQKFYKIAGVITGILVTFGALFYSCGSLAVGDYDWGEIVGITDEMITELEKPVDENLLFSDGKILPVDLESCKVILTEAGANIFESGDEELVASKDFVLNSKEIGALVNEMLVGSDSLIKMNLLDLKIYKDNDYFFEQSIVRVNLQEVIEDKELPTIYLKATSKIEVLSGNICVLNTKLQINMIEENINEDIVELLEKYSNFSAVSATNSLVNSVIDLFAKSIQTTIAIKEDMIEFKAKR